MILFFATLFLQKTQAQQTPFEKSNGLQTATYFEAIDWFKQLDKKYNQVLVKEKGMTDAGYPLHLVLVSSDGKFDAVQWHQQKKAVILINNGIHPGEPDGIDASMMLVRDLATKKITLPNNVALGFIPVYNIGGCLNRGSTSRANQNGPLEYGFRGNAQNLDLNRDFTKCDSKEAKAFAQIFHELNPDVLIDNHVSDGADYQHTMTLLTTQYDKLNSNYGTYLRGVFEPSLYRSMKSKNWDMIPYVNFETTDINKGMDMFYDPPRYSSGYAALFQAMAFVPETHMLKAYKDRVIATYDLMVSAIEESSKQSIVIKVNRESAVENFLIKKDSFALSWKIDTTRFTTINFKGYEQAIKISNATGLSQMFYDKTKPFSREVKFYNYFLPEKIVKKPLAYIIPQGWHAVIDLLKINNVTMQVFKKDTLLEVEAYKIEEYKSLPRPYEKHHKNYAVKTNTSTQKIKILKGDHIIYLNQPANRYLVEMLEPTGDDSFFAWNFFDAILQQKEGYSDYRWDDVAAEVLKNNQAIKQKLDAKKKEDEKFAANASAQLDFVYKNSTYYEPSHNRYPVYRLVK